MLKVIETIAEAKAALVAAAVVIGLLIYLFVPAKNVCSKASPDFDGIRDCMSSEASEGVRNAFAKDQIGRHLELSTTYSKASYVSDKELFAVLGRWLEQTRIICTRTLTDKEAAETSKLLNNLRDDEKIVAQGVVSVLSSKRFDLENCSFSRSR